MPRETYDYVGYEDDKIRLHFQSKTDAIQYLHEALGDAGDRVVAEKLYARYLCWDQQAMGPGLTISMPLSDRQFFDDAVDVEVVR